MMNKFIIFTLVSMMPMMNMIQTQHQQRQQLSSMQAEKSITEDSYVSVTEYENDAGVSEQAPGEQQDRQVSAPAVNPGVRQEDQPISDSGDPQKGLTASAGQEGQQGYKESALEFSIALVCGLCGGAVVLYLVLTKIVIPALSALIRIFHK